MVLELKYARFNVWEPKLHRSMGLVGNDRDGGGETPTGDVGPRRTSGLKRTRVDLDLNLPF